MRNDFKLSSFERGFDVNGSAYTIYGLYAHRSWYRLMKSSANASSFNVHRKMETSFQDAWVQNTILVYVRLCR